MAKRRTHGSDDFYDGYEDDPIGLTSAFEVIKNPQSVEYDKGDEAIGLTEAFAAVGPAPERSWDETGKWKDFDWNASWDAPAFDDEPSPEQEPVAASDAYPSDERESPSRPVAAQQLPAREEPREINVEKDLAHATAATSRGNASRRGRHAAHAQELSPRMRRSHRVRRILIALVVLLVLGACLLGYVAFKTISQGQQEAADQAKAQIETPKETTTDADADDTVETAAQLTDVPALTGLFGKTADAAVEELGRGAIVSSNQKVKEKNSTIKTNVTVALADEPADSKTGTPSVYLGLDKNGKIIQAGYSASANALGFGSLSFADAVNNEHVIEKTLAKIGVDVDEGTAKLPDDRAKYATYASDKTTVTKERCSFDGDIKIDGKKCTWSAVLSYDYTTQVITGNLSDTVRIIYVYVTQ